MSTGVDAASVRGSNPSRASESGPRRQAALLGFSRRPASAPPPQLANSVQLPTPIRLGSSLDYSQSTLSNGDGEAVWVGVDTFWDSTTVPNDTYTLQSVAFDAAGNAAPSTGVTIVVNNPSPTTIVGLPANNAARPENLWLGGAASPGVTSVQYEISGQPQRRRDWHRHADPSRLACRLEHCDGPQRHLHAAECRVVRPRGYRRELGHHNHGGELSDSRYWRSGAPEPQ